MQMMIPDILNLNDSIIQVDNYIEATYQVFNDMAGDGHWKNKQMTINSGENKEPLDPKSQQNAGNIFKGILLAPKSTKHYFDVIMGTMASQITSVSIVY